MRPTLALFAAISLTAGCSEFDMGVRDTSSQEFDTASDSTNDTAGETVRADWVKISGALAIASGVADATGSSMSWTFYDPKLAPICSIDTPLTELVETTPPIDEPIVAWWTVTTDPSVDDTACAKARPAELRVGVGALSPQLYPAMSAASLETDTSMLYGLYIQVSWEDPIDEQTPLWVYGVAGTQGSYDGDESPVLVGPLPDGSYTLDALHLIAMP
ncbi:MAG: hypothetical protein KC912_16825 [Proteobacteria bacterium]|nr:hypothetical protein [Pseudomonadota bacterium]